MNKVQSSNLGVNKTDTLVLMPDDQRKLALKKLDEARLGWPHIKACLVSGIGFYTDAYDLFVIALAVQMIGYSYCYDYKEFTPSFCINGNDAVKSKVSPGYDKGIKVTALFGTLTGQLVFGYLADRLGRKKMYGSELLIIVGMTVIQCFASDLVSGMNICVALMIWRYFLGVGIGGDYPLSAIITSEFANTRNRGALIAAVFSMQGFGILTGSLIAVILLAIFQTQISSPDPEISKQYVDIVWRLLIGFGAIPGCIAIYFRLTIPESPRYTMDVKGNIDKAAQDTSYMLKKNDVSDESQSQSEDTLNSRTPLMEKTQKKASWADFKSYYSEWNNLKVLLGTSVTWFALDVAFYGINLNTPIILKALHFNKNNIYESLQHTAVEQLIVAALGAVPGYWFTVYFVDKWGRKFIQLMGFIILTILFFILGFAYDYISSQIWLFLIFYASIQFFCNFGPNATTFIIPGEVFPTRYRSTCHGIAAASGKAGAILALLCFASMKNIGGEDKFIPYLFIIFGVFMAIGLGFTFLIPETKGKSLEELSGE